MAYNPAGPSHSRHLNVGQTSPQTNYRATSYTAENAHQYEQQSPYAHYDDVVKSSPGASQLKERNHDGGSDQSMDEAPYDITWSPDNTQYRFLQRTSERDLSQVLGEASRISNPPFERNDNPTSLGRSRSIVEYSPNFNRHQSISPRPGHFYNDAAIHPGMQTENNGIRVPTSPPPGCTSPDMDDTGNATSPNPWSQLSDEQFSRIPLDHLTSVQGLRRAQDNDQGPGEWETVTDEQRGSMNLYQHSTIGRVIHGSSIADFSDRHLPEDAYNLDEPSLGDHTGWWERHTRCNPPRGSARATEGTISAYRLNQIPKYSTRMSFCLNLP